MERISGVDGLQGYISTTVYRTASMPYDARERAPTTCCGSTFGLSSVRPPHIVTAPFVRPFDDHNYRLSLEEVNPEVS